MGLHGHQYRQAVAGIIAMPELVQIRIQEVIPKAQSASPKVMANLIGDFGNYSIRLSWSAQLEPPRVGEVWQARLKLKPPHDFANPTSFNYRRYLLSHHIIATGYVLNAKRIKSSVSARPAPRLQRWRHAIEKKLHQYDSGPLLMAMTLGERGHMTSQHWEVLSKTGTAHLMAISGLHLGICFAWLLWLLHKGRSLALRLGFTRTELAAIWPLWLAAMLSGGYAVFSGLALPTLRAWLFVLVFCLLKSFHIKMSPWRLLGGIASAFLVCSPQQAYSTSFWLSFSAVACVLVAIKLAEGWRWLGWRRLVTIQLCIIVGMLPLQAGLWGVQSLLAPLINLVAIPWIGVSILPLALLGVIVNPVSGTVSSWLFYLADLQLSLLYSGLEQASGSSSQVLYLDLYTAISWLLVLALVVGSFFFIKSRWLSVASAGLIPLCLVVQLCRSYQPQFTLDLLDVGQGQALVVRKDWDVLLYDVGPAYPSGFNVADAVINPYFQQQGIDQLNALVVSHSDMDHSGSEPYLWPMLEIAKRFQPEPQPGYVTCRLNISAELESLKARFLSPSSLVGNDNDDSCVLYLKDETTQVLLTGDIGKAREALLVEKFAEQLKADVLLVPHHGSRSSSSLPFIQKVSPQWALASAGYRNRWRFPSQEVVKRYQKLHIPLLTTAELGQIRMTHKKGQWHWRGDCQMRWPTWYRCDLNFTY